MAKEVTMTRIAVKSLDQAKEIVEAKTEYRSVAHMLEVLIEREAQKIKREAKKAE